MSNTTITNVGLDYVTSAHSHGLLIAVKYFVPVYDWRIDPTLRADVTSVSAISAVAAETTGRSSPYGEILYNYGTSAYKLSDQTDLVYVLSGVGETSASTSVIINSKQNNGPVAVNLSADTEIPLSNHFRGNAVALSASPSVGKWTFNPEWSAVAGVNPDVSSDRTKLYKVIDYHPIRESGQTSLKGNFACRVAQDVGTMKFNKLALYVVQYDSGVETSSAPGFFGEAYFTSPIQRTDIGDGYSEITVDVQIQLSAGGVDTWDQVFYGSSADYWSKVPEGLHSSEKVSIGVFQGTNGEPEATIQLGQPVNSASDYERIPQLRLDYPHSTPANRKNVTMEVLSTGNIEISASDPNVYFLPVKPAYLGSTAYPFQTLRLSGTISASSDMGTNTEQLLRERVLISTSEYSPLTTWPYFNIRKTAVQFYDDDGSGGLSYGYDSSATYHNTFYGGDLVRDANDLVIQTRLQSIYIIAGAKNNSTYYGNMGLRHLYNISDVNNGVSQMMEDGNWQSASYVHIVGRAGLKTYGPLYLNYVPESDTGPLSQSPKTSAWGIMATKSTTNPYMMLVAGLNPYTSVSTDLVGGYESNNSIVSQLLRKSLQDSTSGTFNPYGEESGLGSYIVENYINSATSNLVIGAYNTWFMGNVYPNINEQWELGNYEKKWKELHTKFINLGSTSQENLYLAEGTASNLFGLAVEQFFAGTSPNVIRTTILSPAQDAGGNPYRGDVDEERIDLGGGTDLYRRIYNIYARNGNITTFNSVNINASTIAATSYMRSSNGYYSYGRNNLYDGKWVDLGSFTHSSSAADSTYFSLANFASHKYDVTVEHLKFMVVGKSIFFRLPMILKRQSGASTIAFDIGYIKIDDLLSDNGYSINVVDDGSGSTIESRRIIWPFRSTISQSIGIIDVDIRDGQIYLLREGDHGSWSEDASAYYYIQIMADIS